MVLIVEKQLEQALIYNDAKNVIVLGVEQGCLLLYAATSSFGRKSSERTFIGCVNLQTKEQKVLFRHSSLVKITHASLNAARTLCCFVTKTEPTNFDVYIAEIDSTSQGRLFSLNYSRSSAIRAHLTANDVVLLFYRNGITVFRIPNTSKTLDRATSVDGAAQLENCIYYQWDALIQRLHVIQDRGNASTASQTLLTNGARSAYIYTMYIVTGRGQFESFMTAEFDLQVSESPTSHSNFEILSNSTDLYLCWQSTMREENPALVQYATVSLGHGRTVVCEKQLNLANMGLFQSRRVHFGFLAGGYMFAFLRGEFVHLIDWNIHSKFINHLFLPDETNNLPYDTKYTSQRGLPDKTSTLIYEKKNLIVYTIRADPNEFIQKFDSLNFQSIIALSMTTPRDHLLEKVVEKILKKMSDDLNTKSYLKEILTALIFNRLSRKIHNLKYQLVFPSTTAVDRQATDKSRYRSIPHSRHCIPESGRATSVDKEFFEALRQSFELARRYRDKLPYQHDVAQIDSDTESDLGISDEPVSTPRRPSFGAKMSLGRLKPSNTPISPKIKEDLPQSFTVRDRALYNSVKENLKKLHKSWEDSRIQELALVYVETAQKETDRLIELLTRSADFNRTQVLSGDDAEFAMEKYGPLLMVLEKLYLAIIELGFSPTENLRRTLLEVSFRALPFAEFVKAIDQNILLLTEEFVARVVLELDDEPKSYAMKEQLIFMLANTNSEVHSRLFGYMKTDRGKRTAAQLLIARRFPSESRSPTSPHHYLGPMMNDISEMLNVNDGSNSQSRLIEQAVVTFFRDCNQRGNFTEDEMAVVKNGLMASVLSVVP